MMDLKHYFWKFYADRLRELTVNVCSTLENRSLTVCICVNVESASIVKSVHLRNRSNFLLVILLISRDFRLGGSIYATGTTIEVIVLLPTVRGF